METFHLYVYIVQIILNIQVTDAMDGTEPTCLSRFDYDYKMLTKMVNIENELGKLKAAYASALDESKDQRLNIEEQTREIKKLSGL